MNKSIITKNIRLTAAGHTTAVRCPIPAVSLPTLPTYLQAKHFSSQTEDYSYLSPFTGYRFNPSLP